MGKKKRILGFCNYGTSGIAYNVRLPMAHWHEQGHEVWLLAIGFDGNVNAVDRVMYPYAERMLPCRGPMPHGHMEVPAALAHVQPDVLFTGIDLWLMHHLVKPERDATYANNAPARHVLGHRTRHYAHMAMFPLENLTSEGFIPSEIENLVGSVDLPIAYARFSQRAILRSTGLDVPCIPLPIDTGIFRPRDPRIFRERFGIADDTFLITMVATNQWRKLWGEFIEVMGRMTRRHPNIRVLPWAHWDHRVAGGVDMRDLFYRHDLGPFLIDPGAVAGNADDAFMAEMYSATDVLVLTTAAEGAGLPPLHARACGTPALVSANTSNVEFAGHAFELIPSAPSGLHHGFYGLPNTVVYATDVAVLEERLEILYQEPALRREIGEAGRLAMQAYAPDKIFPLWDLALDAATG